MNDADKQEFSKVIRSTMESYQRQMLMPDTLRLWFELFSSYSIEQFRVACLRYIVDEPKFPPTPAQLLELIRGKKISGYLGSEEAWSRAVLACDETETVVMNDEIAQAWGVAKPIMDLGDEVGARMAFKEAYQRLVANAIGPAKWWPSIGSDPHKRDSALSEAKRSGLLPAPHVAGLLGSVASDKGAKASPEGLKRLKEMMEQLQLKSAQDAEAAAQKRREEREVEEDKKSTIDAQVQDYQRRSA